MGMAAVYLAAALRVTFAVVRDPTDLRHHRSGATKGYATVCYTGRAWIELVKAWNPPIPFRSPRMVGRLYAERTRA